MPMKYKPAPALPSAEHAGIDVSKAELVTGFYPSAVTFKMPNDDAGCAELAEVLAEVDPPVVIVESTGGYQQLIADALYAAVVPVAVVNPRLTAKFAEGVNGPAKTDERDAVTLARFGSHVSVPLYRPASDELVQLQSLVTRREDLIQIRVREKNRSRRAKGYRAQSVHNLMTSLNREITEIDALVSVAIAADEGWSHRKEVLCSVPGVGDVTAHVLIAWMPELGAYNRNSIAHLAGLAPITRQSGNHTERGRITGGRSIVRRSMYLATLSAIRCNPTIKAKYARFLKDGKPKKVALIACARTLLLILNALVRKNELWSESGRR